LGSDYLAKTILGFKQSAIHRLQIWETFSNLSLLSPIHGYSISSGHFLYKFDNIISQIPNNLHKFVDTWHPHNNFLEIWLDLGIIGIIILILFISELFKSKWINNRGHFSTLVSIISVGSCANGFWQGWWITAICFVVLIYRISDSKKCIQ
jgi:O-antigen ligase